MNALPAMRLRITWAWLTLLVLAGFGCTPVIYQTPPPAPAPPTAAPPPAAPRPIFYVNASRLNLRACPGMDCPKVAALERNEIVEKLGESDDWSQVRVKKDGTLGWVATRFLSPAAVEAAPPPPGLPRPPETARPEKPGLPEKPVKPAETAEPGARKKPAEETKPRRTPKPAEAAEPPPGKPTEKPAPAKAPPEEKKAPAPEPQPEPKKGIRIM
ncbi:MAG: hypothetical protein FJ128_00480 [Deltaproteobacteria bacterium]|nr:hypothetical protein [Deltaproteobacteria bacterium]